MKSEEVNQRTKEAVDFLVAALESGRSEVLTAYLGAMAKFHTYSFLCCFFRPLPGAGAGADAHESASGFDGAHDPFRAVATSVNRDQAARKEGSECRG
jgi:hypothetical protein